MIPEPDLMQLTPLDMRAADCIGRARNRYALSQGYQSRHTEAGKRYGSLENHVIGARSELAIARLLRLPWRSHVGTIHGTDVGHDVEVRCRRLRSPGDVIRGGSIQRGMLTLGMRDRGKEDKAFVLVHRYIVDPPDVMRAMGWRLGGDVLQDRWWQEDPDIPAGVYRLPHDELRAIPELIELLDQRNERRHDARLERYISAADEDHDPAQP